MKINTYTLNLKVNDKNIRTVLISQHYKIKHARYMSDDLILEIVLALDGKKFSVNSSTAGINYYAADVLLQRNGTGKIYRIIWLHEGDELEVLGVVNAYRRSKKKLI